MSLYPVHHASSPHACDHDAVADTDGHRVRRSLVVEVQNSQRSLPGLVLVVVAAVEKLQMDRHTKQLNL